MSASAKQTKQAPVRRARGWVGVFFGEGNLELTAVRSAGTELNVEKQTSASVPAPVEGVDASAGWQSAAQALREQVNPQEHLVVTAVGGEDVLCHTLRLPTTQADELQQMLELQLDSLTPLPLEEIVYAYEPLETTDTETRLLVAVARKAAINERVAVLESAGLPPEVVAVDALAVFHAFLTKQLLPLDDKLNTFVLLAPTASHVIVHSRGVPVVVRSLAITDPASLQPVLREELQRTLVASEIERPGVAMGRLTFAAWGERFRSEAETLASGWNGPTECLTNGTTPSPAFSLCLETTSETRPYLNLLPDEWRQRRRRAQVRKMMVRGAIAVAVLYLIGLASFLTLVGLQRARVQKVDAEIRSKQKAFDQARATRAELMAMQRQLDTKYSALETMREVTMLMPEGLKLNSFVFKKDQTVTLRGQGPAANMVNDFIGRLEKCELFSTVKTLSERSEAAGLTKFEVLCSFKSAVGAPAPGTGTHGAK